MEKLPNFEELNLEYYQIVPENDLAVGERIFVDIGGNPIMIINIGGQIHAISDYCSHDHGPLGDGDVNDNEITCPRHGARFELQTGRALSLPATAGIPIYPVRVNNGMIEVGLKLDR